jgi:hypothetical protein
MTGELGDWRPAVILSLISVVLFAIGIALADRDVSRFAQTIGGPE